MSLLEHLRDKTEKEYKKEVRDSLMLQAGIGGAAAGVGLGTLAGIPLVRQQKSLLQSLPGLHTRRESLQRQLANLNEVIPGTGDRLVDMVYQSEGWKTMEPYLKNLPDGIRDDYYGVNPDTGKGMFGPKLRRVQKPFVELERVVLPRITEVGEQSSRLGMRAIGRRAGGGLLGAALGAAIIRHIDKKKEGPLFGR